MLQKNMYREVSILSSKTSCYCAFPVIFGLIKADIYKDNKYHYQLTSIVCYSETTDKQ